MRWWKAVAPDQDHGHVIPLNDLVEHDETEDCICGPLVEPVEREDGSVTWLVTHHSLDGREQYESAR